MNYMELNKYSKDLVNLYKVIVVVDLIKKWEFHKMDQHYIKVVTQVLWGG